LLESVEEATLINNRFGEGVNPKFRRVRSGLACIGLPHSDEFLNNRSKRIIYGIPLGRAAYEFLRGEIDDPEYFFDISSPEKVVKGVETIKEFWNKRWLLMRIKNDEVLKKLMSVRKTDILLSNEFENESSLSNEPSLSKEEENKEHVEVLEGFQQITLFESIS